MIAGRIDYTQELCNFAVLNLINKEVKILSVIILRED